jgi:hypothetical protein
MELQKSQGALTQHILDLGKSIDQRMQKLDKLDDLRIEIKGLSTILDATCKQLVEVKEKADRVHTWVVGAAAVVSAIVIVATIASRFIPVGITTSVVNYPGPVPSEHVPANNR